jgi:hypothetical protein
MMEAMTTKPMKVSASFGGDALDEVVGGRHVVLLAGPEDQPHRQAKRVYAGMVIQARFSHGKGGGAPTLSASNAGSGRPSEEWR